nr:hypothetical protein [Anaerolineae bacterium]
MPDMTRALYGTWHSPVTAALVAHRLRFNDVQWVGEALVWHESRGAANALMAQRLGQAPRELGGDKVGRGKIAYGGGDFAGHPDGTLYFIGRDGRIYRTTVDGAPARAITPAFGGAASPVPSPDGRWVAYTHAYEDIDALALVELGGGWPRKLDDRADFAQNPVWSPDGACIAWVAYDMPNMPWDGTRLMLHTLANGQTEVLAGEAQAYAIAQPSFSPDGKTLAYLSDESGFGHLMDSRHVVVRRSVQARHSLWLIDTQTGHETPLLAGAGYTYYEQIAVRASDGRVACIASATDTPHEVISFYPVAGAPVTVHARSVQAVFAAGALSVAEPIHWEGTDGETVHGLYYPPASA